ncbi:MAG: glycosyltransferase family 9 protein [Spirochaetia bacterium]|nr:glycosyltransferase family 9 protein [Spirochaetia bacterium]
MDNVEKKPAAGIKKVLTIKLCCLGDIIQLTPALRSLKAAGCEVHHLCVPWVSDLVDMVPFIDKKHVMNPKKIGSIISTLRVLRAEKFDLAINFHRDLKSCLFAAAAGARISAGFKWKGPGRFLLGKTFEFDPKAHESRRYTSITKGLGFEERGEYTQIKPSIIPVKNSGTNIIGLFPGGGKNPGTVMTTKRWPEERFVEISSMIKNAQIRIFGGLMDTDVTSSLAAKIPGAVLVETKSLQKLADEISQLDVFIAGDTGPLHMAAALGVKTIGLFGPTSPELVAPLGKNSAYVWGREQCAPCYIPETVHKKEFTNCTDNRCMKSITAEQVYEQVNKLLRS